MKIIRLALATFFFKLMVISYPPTLVEKHIEELRARVHGKTPRHGKLGRPKGSKNKQKSRRYAR